LSGWPRYLAIFFLPPKMLQHQSVHAQLGKKLPAESKHTDVFFVVHHFSLSAVRNISTLVVNCPINPALLGALAKASQGLRWSQLHPLTVARMSPEG